jgi:hypothetical protein
MYGVQVEDRFEFRVLLDDQPIASSEILPIDPPHHRQSMLASKESRCGSDSTVAGQTR